MESEGFRPSLYTAACTMALAKQRLTTTAYKLWQLTVSKTRDHFPESSRIPIRCPESQQWQRSQPTANSTSSTSAANPGCFLMGLGRGGCHVTVKKCSAGEGRIRLTSNRVDATRQGIATNPRNISATAMPTINDGGTTPDTWQTNRRFRWPSWGLGIPEVMTKTRDVSHWAVYSAREKFSAWAHFRSPNWGLFTYFFFIYFKICTKQDEFRAHSLILK